MPRVPARAARSLVPAARRLCEPAHRAGPVAGRREIAPPTGPPARRISAHQACSFRGRSSARLPARLTRSTNVPDPRRPRRLRSGRRPGRNACAEPGDHRAARGRADRADDSAGARAPPAGVRRVSPAAEVAARRNGGHRQPGRRARAAHHRAGEAARHFLSHPRRRLVDRRERPARSGAGAPRRQLRHGLRVGRIPARARASISGRPG